jgi:hypothetical protein
MRIPSRALCLFAILLAACSSAPSGANGGTDSSGHEPEEVSDVPTVTGRAIRVEWVNLDPARKDPPLGLINRSSPELRQMYANPASWQHIKPIDDLQMADLLSGFGNEGFFDEAKKGRPVESLRMGEGKGAVCLRNGDETWALVFGPGMAETAIPELYRDLKHAIIYLHSTTLHLAPAAPADPNRTFQIPTKSRRVQ